MAAELTATVDRFEGELAVLRLSDGQELVVPRSLLPAGVSEGAVLAVELRSQPEATAAREHTARQLLTDILQGK